MLLAEDASGASQKREFLLWLSLFAVNVLGWVAWRAYRSISSWLRIDRGVRNCGARKGPSFLSTLIFEPRYFHRLLQEWVREFGTVFWYRMGPFHVVMVSDPYIMAEVLRQPELFDKHFELQRSITEGCSEKGHPNMLSNITNEHWRMIRRAAAPSFSLPGLKRVYPDMQGVLSRLVDHVRRCGRGGQPVNMTTVLECESMDMIGIVGFDMDVRGLASLEPGFQGLDKVTLARDAMLEAAKRLSNPLRTLAFWSSDVREGARAFPAFQRWMKGLLEEVRPKEAMGQLRSDCVAARLLSLTEPATGRPLPDDLILPEFAVTFMAGFETMSHAMTWALYLVTQHPQVEAKILAELEGLGLLASPVKPAPRLVEWEDLPKLVYLEAVINETLRMYSPAPLGTAREAMCDTTLGGRYRIPKGTLVWTHFPSIMVSEEFWEDAASFRPERFLKEGVIFAPPRPPLAQNFTQDASTAEPARGNLQEDGQKERPVKIYVPFSEGIRNCVGLTLAKVNMTATLATLLSNFSIRLAPEMGGPEGVRKRELYQITVSVEGGMRLLCQPRDGTQFQ